MMRNPSALRASIVAVIWLGLAQGGAPGQAPIIREDRKPSFPIEADALAFVGKFERTALLKDEVFIGALKDLAKAEMSPRAKADAFALMQERIGWLFAGALRQFPGTSYAETTGQMLSNYIQYQDKMPPDLDVAPLLELAKAGRAEHPLRASKALLLAVILNAKAAKEAVRGAITRKGIDSAPVPAIDLHNTAMAAALVRDPKVVGLGLDLLPTTESEESREDLLAACGIYSDDGLRDKIEAFLKARFPASFDHSVRTALRVLVHGSPPDRFRAFYKGLGDATKDPAAIDKLRKFWDARFADELPPGRPKQDFWKIWDGFDAAPEADGLWITQGKFRIWFSFK